MLNGIGSGERRVLGIEVWEGPVVGLLGESSAIIKIVSGILSENPSPSIQFFHLSKGSNDVRRTLRREVFGEVLSRSICPGDSVMWPNM